MRFPNDKARSKFRKFQFIYYLLVEYQVSIQYLSKDFNIFFLILYTSYVTSKRNTLQTSSKLRTTKKTHPSDRKHPSLRCHPGPLSRSVGHHEGKHFPIKRKTWKIKMLCISRRSISSELRRKKPPCRSRAPSSPAPPLPPTPRCWTPWRPLGRLL